MLKVVQEAGGANATSRPMLDEIVRDGARAMLAAALQAEVAAYVDAHRGELDEAGHRLVVRNGYHAERVVTTAAWGGAGGGAAGQRQTDRRGER